MTKICLNMNIISSIYTEIVNIVDPFDIDSKVGFETCLHISDELKLPDTFECFHN